MADDRLDRLDYYTLLSVPADAATAEIRRAFRRFARKYHPDRFAGALPAKIERASQIYRRGSEAFQVLTDEVARRAYDASLRGGVLRLSSDARNRAAAGQTHGGAASSRLRASHGLSSLPARAFYDKARHAEAAGDLRAAWRALKAALLEEPQSTHLQEELVRLEGKLRGT